MIYLDRGGRRIDSTQWQKLQADESYRIIRLYDNGEIRLMVAWKGKMSLQQKNSFRDTWPLFEIGMWNYDSEGVLRPDPVVNGNTYPTIELAVKAYEDILLTWTNSEVDDEGQLIEVDNNLAPPPPPDPNKPESKIKELPDDFVAW